MPITKEMLEKEKAALESQLVEHKQTIEKTKNCHEAVHGALQMVNHLLAQLDQEEVG